jgi:hypothetical protein
LAPGHGLGAEQTCDFGGAFGQAVEVGHSTEVTWI